MQLKITGEHRNTSHRKTYERIDPIVRNQGKKKQYPTPIQGDIGAGKFYTKLQEQKTVTLTHTWTGANDVYFALNSQ